MKTRPLSHSHRKYWCGRSCVQITGVTFAKWNQWKINSVSRALQQTERKRFLWPIIEQEEEHLFFTARTPGQFIENYIKHRSHLVFTLCASLCVYATVLVYSRCKVGLFLLGAYLFILCNVLNSGQDECTCAFVCTSKVGSTCMTMTWTCLPVSPFYRKRKSIITAAVHTSLQL